MIRHKEISNVQLHKLIRRRDITLCGNGKLGIYGTLSCASGKRMKKENRLFFENASEAIHNGFRPCAHCMRAAFILWKAESDLAISPV